MAKKNYRVRYDRIFGAFAILIIIIILLISGCSKRNKAKKQNEKTNPTENMSFATNDTNKNQAYMNVSLETKKFHSGNLILVNEKNPCLFDAQAVEDGTSTDINFVTIKSILDAKNTTAKPYTASDWEVGLDRETAQAMDSWFTAFYKETGLNDLRMIGGYKPEAIDLDFQTGRTITVGIFPEIGSSYAYKPEGNYAWLQEHAKEYGFILRYPENKEDYFDDTITERRTATFRYVGIPSAIYMTEKNICLEEFLQEIKKYTLENMLVITSAEKTYHMYYVPANMSDSVTTFQIPDDRIYYEVSGNNIDGFIVTIFQ
ncbi:MAG: D-alanyl-D-alanine carboxypeptidase family protein [Oscillospiraceae bacterium]|nr:D-alanyl-D-alanine carboxypeptidase family protein [Oscillospiraceae bacterium]